MKLDDAKVLITGGSSGIGKATARMLHARGAKVAICGRNEERLRKAAEETGAIGIPADVSDEADVTRLVARTIDQLGGYDVLINNAGIGTFAPLIETTSDEMRRVWETNVLGAMLMARESAKHFISQRRGNIVNVASTAGLKAGPGGSAYASTKFALRGMTESWRAELRTHDIRVLLVNPSEVVTDFFRAAGRTQKPSDRKLRGEEIAHAIVAMLEMDDRGMLVEATVHATNPD